MPLNHGKATEKKFDAGLYERIVQSPFNVQGANEVHASLRGQGLSLGGGRRNGDLPGQHADRLRLVLNVKPHITRR